MINKIKKLSILAYALWIAFNPVLIVFAQSTQDPAVLASQVRQEILLKLQSQTASPTTSQQYPTGASDNQNSQVAEELSRVQQASQNAQTKVQQKVQEAQTESQQKISEASSKAIEKANSINSSNDKSDNVDNGSSGSAKQQPNYTFDGPLNENSESLNSNNSQQNTNNQNTATVSSFINSDEANILTNSNIEPVQTSAGDVQISGSVQTGNNDGSVKVNTGDVKIQGDVLNNANINNVNVNQTHHSDTSIFNNNKNVVVNLFDYFGSSGQNTIEKNDGQAEIDTGNVDIRLNLLNLTNTNITNSTWGQYFYNSQGPLFQDINIEEAWHKASHNDCRFGECAGEFKVVNMNESIVKNKVKVLGISGQNKIKDADGDGIIRTGDVRVATNLINFLNTNLTGSEWDLSVINIFDDWKGDLILPGKQKYDSNKKNYNLFPNTTINNTNDVLISNDIKLEASSGDNLANNNDGIAQITTGDALTKSNIQNVVNANFHGGDWFLIIINRFNNWEGQIFNKPEEIGQLIQDKSIIFSSFLSDEMLKSLHHNDDDAILSVTNNNLGELRNEILIQALTGGNEIQNNDGKAIIETGKALILANVLNVANVSITGGDWHLAVINVFGNWQGNVLFGKPDLKITLETNKTELRQVGETVDVTVTYANTGSTDSYNTNLTMNYDRENLKPLNPTGSIFDNGKIVWNLGKITQGSSKKLTQRFEFIGNNLQNKTGEIKAVIASSLVNDLNMADNMASITLAFKNINNNNQNSSSSGNQSNSSSSDNSSQQITNNTNTNHQNNSNTNQTGSGGSSSGNSGSGSFNSSSNSNNYSSSSSAGANGSSSAIVQGPIEISKTNSSKNYVKPGDVVSYVIRVKNISDSNLYGLVITDTMKSASGSVINTDSWDFDQLNPKKGFEIKYDIVISDETPAGSYINYAKIEGVDARGVKFTATAQSTIIVKNEPLVITTQESDQNQQIMMSENTISNYDDKRSFVKNTPNNQNFYRQPLNNLIPKMDDVIITVKETLGKLVKTDSYARTIKPRQLTTQNTATFTPRYIQNDSFDEQNQDGALIVASNLLDNLTRNYPKLLMLFVVLVYMTTFLNFGVIYEGRNTKNRKRSK